MNNKTAFIRRHLSALVFSSIYLIIILVHLFLESFIPEIQMDMLMVMLPFILLGGILDYIISRNTVLPKTYRIYVQLLPAGVFILYALTALLVAIGREPSDIFNYLFWLFITAPFFIASYNKEGHRNRLISALIGTALVALAYLYLTTMTQNLDGGSGLIIYLISYFAMLYSASGIKRMPFLSTVIGAANAVILLLFYKYPSTDTLQAGGWDFDIAENFEILMLEFFILCILICLFGVVKNSRENNVK